MSVNSLVQELIDAGVHFGHRASRWNPKMRPYIYGRKTKFTSSTSARQFVDSCGPRNSFLKSPAMEVSFFSSAPSDKLLLPLLAKPNVARCLTLANVGSAVR